MATIIISTCTQYILGTKTFINEGKRKLEIVIESHGYWIRVSISCRKCGEPWYNMFDHNSCKREGRLQIQEHFELLVRS